MRTDPASPIRPLRWKGIAAGAILAACASASASDDVVARPAVPSCDMTTASEWIGRWLDAWAFTAAEILRLPEAPPPDLLLFDSACLYTNAEVLTGPAQPGPHTDLSKPVPLRETAPLRG